MWEEALALLSSMATERIDMDTITYVIWVTWRQDDTVTRVTI